MKRYLSIAVLVAAVSFAVATFRIPHQDRGWSLRASPQSVEAATLAKAIILQVPIHTPYVVHHLSQSHSPPYKPASSETLFPGQVRKTTSAVLIRNPLEVPVARNRRPETAHHQVLPESSNVGLQELNDPNVPIILIALDKPLISHGEPQKVWSQDTDVSTPHTRDQLPEKHVASAHGDWRASRKPWEDIPQKGWSHQAGSWSTPREHQQSNAWKAREQLPPSHKQVGKTWPTASPAAEDWQSSPEAKEDSKPTKVVILFLKEKATQRQKPQVQPAVKEPSQDTVWDDDDCEEEKQQEPIQDTTWPPPSSKTKWDDAPTQNLWQEESSNNLWTTPLENDQDRAWTTEKSWQPSTLFRAASEPKGVSFRSYSTGKNYETGYVVRY